MVHLVHQIRPNSFPCLDNSLNGIMIDTIKLEKGDRNKVITTMMAQIPREEQGRKDRTVNLPRNLPDSDSDNESTDGHNSEGENDLNRLSSYQNGRSGSGKPKDMGRNKVKVEACNYNIIGDDQSNKSGQGSENNLAADKLSSQLHSLSLSKDSAAARKLVPLLKDVFIHLFRLSSRSDGLKARGPDRRNHLAFDHGCTPYYKQQKRSVVNGSRVVAYVNNSTSAACTDDFECFSHIMDCVEGMLDREHFAEILASFSLETYDQAINNALKDLNLEDFISCHTFPTKMEPGNTKQSVLQNMCFKMENIKIPASYEMQADTSSVNDIRNSGQQYNVIPKSVTNRDFNVPIQYSLSPNPPARNVEYNIPYVMSPIHSDHMYGIPSNISKRNDDFCVPNNIHCCGNQTTGNEELNIPGQTQLRLSPNSSLSNSGDTDSCYGSGGSPDSTVLMSPGSPAYHYQRSPPRTSVSSDSDQEEPSRTKRNVVHFPATRQRNRIEIGPPELKPFGDAITLNKISATQRLQDLSNSTTFCVRHYEIALVRVFMIAASPDKREAFTKFCQSLMSTLKTRQESKPHERDRLMLSVFAHIQFLKYRVHEYGQALTCMDTNGHSLMHIAAVELALPEIARYIAESIGYLGLHMAKDEEGNTPLHLVARLGDSHAEVLAELLMACTADERPLLPAMIYNSDGQTPLHMAAASTHPHVTTVMILLRKGACPFTEDKFMKSAVDYHVALMAGCQPRLKKDEELLKKMMQAPLSYSPRDLQVLQRLLSDSSLPRDIHSLISSEINIKDTRTKKSDRH